MKNRLKVVLDTNVLLVSISSKSKYHEIFKNLIENKYDISISNEILTEYEEVISRKYDKKVANNVLKSLLILPNIHKTNIHFKWNLISDDKDDNKFVDCALNSNSNLLVTNDSHFNILKNLDFPKIEVISSEEYLSLIKNHFEA